MNDDEKVYLYDRSEMLKRQRDTAEEERDGWKERAMQAEQERQAARVEADHWKAEWALAVNKATHVHYEALHTINTNLRDELVLAEGQRDQAKMEADHWKAEWALAVSEAAGVHAECEAVKQRAEAAEAELEIERMRLAACGVAALGYFNGCEDAYKSASLDDVLKLRAECDALRKAATDAISYMVSKVVACNGLKCREGNCESCCDEDDAAAYVKKSREAIAALTAALAVQP